MNVLCDICARKGISVPAVYDGPTVWGCWAFQCEACWYRLPRELQAMARRIRYQDFMAAIEQARQELAREGIVVRPEEWLETDE